jgi:hypothetical protein
LIVLKRLKGTYFDPPLVEANKLLYFKFFNTTGVKLVFGKNGTDKCFEKAIGCLASSGDIKKLNSSMLSIEPSIDGELFNIFFYFE